MNSGRGRPCGFVGWKANKQWVWVAIDRASRQVVALFVGDRSADGALGLWQALPERYRAQAPFHTDDWRAYNTDHSPGAAPVIDAKEGDRTGGPAIMPNGFSVRFASAVLV